METSHNEHKKFVLGEKPEKSVFRAPDGYFEQLTQRVENRIEGEPDLSFLPAKRPIFLTPTSYFEWLPARIQQRINALQQQPQTAWNWLQNYSLSVRYASLASLCLAIVAGIIWFKSPETASNNTEILASISTQEAADYLQNNGISSSELIDFYAQSNAPLPAVEAAIMHNISAESAAEQLELESINPEDLID